MKLYRFRRLLLVLALSPYAVCLAQPFTLQEQHLDNPRNEPRPVFPVPTENQIRWQETEFYAFFHFGMNTFTDVEWGSGQEDEKLFQPLAVPNPEQWLRLVKAGGMKGGIVTVKHHDGFCTWPTATTPHSVVNAGNEYGRQTNIPRDFQRAARKLGMKYGFYVSPWDANSPYYGTERYVREVFHKQILELASLGSDQFEMWFDGAKGGNVKIDASIYYDMPNIRDSVHRLCPGLIMWGLGGEARWCGTESGYTNETTWSMGTGLSGNEKEWLWLPCEVDTKATDKGWFWHPDEHCRDSEELFRMYLQSVGRNATFILNFPPNRYGLLPPADSVQLVMLGEKLRTRFGKDLARKAHIAVDQTRRGGYYEAKNMTDGNKETYWATEDNQLTATVTLTWRKPQTVRYLMLQEYIRKGQRIKRFEIESTIDGIHWERLAQDVETTTVGYKRIVPLNGSVADSYGPGFRVKGLRVRILDSRACPLLSRIAVF